MRHLVLFLVGVLPLAGCSQPPGSDNPSALGAARGYERAYVFDGPDYFSERMADLDEVTAALRGRPGLRYLEIGPEQGRSLMWMLEHVLTAPGSHATVIDEQLDEQLYKNLRLSRRASDVSVLEGDPAVRLRELPIEGFDIIYINGAHRADRALHNLIGAWQVLAPGGLLLIDDARYQGPRYLIERRKKLPPELTPPAAIEAFLTTHRNQLQVVRDRYQLYLKKRPVDPCLRAEACSVLEPYVWQWDRMELFPIGETTPVPLSDAERQAVIKLVWYRGRRAFPALDNTLRQDPDVRTVVERLGILVQP
jgi:predicted O-methyltransferase YrrM